MVNTTSANNTITKIPEIKDKIEKINILLVDDQEENLLLLSNQLENENRTILQATNGIEALRIAQENSIAVILLDVQMPEMDGFEVARLLMENESTKEIAIIFCTGLSNGEKFTLQGYEEGAVDYLQKPVDLNIVKAKVSVFEKLYRQRFELKKYVEKTEQINKQLHEFVYIVSHDLKAPLRGLASLSEFLKEELKASMTPEVGELLNLMQSRGDRMQKLIEGILHYSRMSNNMTEKENVNLKDLVDNIIDLINIPSHIRVEYPDNLPVLMAEKIKLHEVFQNLFTNAIKYNNKESGFLKMTCIDEQTHYKFAVEDNGMGIKEEHFTKIFGVFQTLQPKDKTDSTGIGLTIVKKLIEQNTGKIWIESEFGKGTTFHFTWPKD